VTIASNRGNNSLCHVKKVHSPPHPTAAP
jgi:hypothetical protein